MTFPSTYYRFSTSEKIDFLKNEMKFNKSRICRRAYWLIHNEGMGQSEAMKKCWSEAKNYRVKLAIELENVSREYKQVSNEFHIGYMNNLIKK